MNQAERDRRLVSVMPSPRQIALENMEFYAFFHFGMNTYTDREWGTGTESPSLFCPEKMNALQWVRAIKKAGMKGAILTCKHHDGFCLWPSRYTDRTVAASPYKDGKGDIVREVSEACEKEGIKFGIYLSPWDLSHPSYGFGKSYDDYYVKQLTELLTGYGEIFSVWLDGACGEGTNGKKQIYDWDRYYETIRSYQPGACISVCGPDVRWCGNEGGQTRVAEWSVVPQRLSRVETIKALSQQEDSEEFRTRKISSKDEDLGSRQALLEEEELIWYPSEVDTSIRPGWFYHSHEDDKVRPLEELLQIYYNSVGGNSTLLLNIPPGPDGLLAAPDLERLDQIGAYLQKAFQDNLGKTAQIFVDWGEGELPLDQISKDDGTFFQTPEGITGADFVFCWPEPVCIRHIVMKEHIPMSQRIENFEISAFIENEKQVLAIGSAVGYKKIVKIEPVKTQVLNIRMLDARVSIAMEFIGVY